MLTRSPSRISVSIFSLVITALLVMSVAGSARVAATPKASAFLASRAQNVDWMTSSQAASLDLSFPVMVPVAIPAPFSGSPSASGSGGYYSLYWVNYGGPPTFLQITGEVGGSLPAGSPADLNVELSVNAAVQGYDAIHDVTTIYDTVWWIAGGVLYTVSSNNMTGTDSLSLANSLIVLQPPVVQELENVPPTEAAPPPSAAPTTQPQPDDGEQTESASNMDDSLDDSDPIVDDSTPELAESAESETGVGGFTDADTLPSQATTDLANVLSGSITLSDGTAGPALPNGGDGTGGIRQITIP